MVVFDTSILLLFLDPNAKPPVDPDTGEAVDRAHERIEFLIDQLSSAGEKIVIPTPALSEALVFSGAAMTDYLSILNGQRCFRIAAFDQKAAIETALSIRDAYQRGGLRIDSDDAEIRKSKVKYDQQIVAVAKAEGAHTIYADDKHIFTLAERAKIKAYRSRDLDLPPEDPQASWDFEDGEE
ncbi:MAG: hypothetical protein AAGB04_24575 [Pseudomonadota bacterium]